MAKTYQPSKDDLEFRNAMLAGGPTPNDFETARLMRGISHEYLSVLAQDNAGSKSAGLKAMIDTEVGRRSTAAALRANRIAWASLAVAVISLAVSIIQIII